jgi:UDP-GlcNAc:undecaprenyl-phosphate GlcNAc-1-phosphate transferase
MFGGELSFVDIALISLLTMLFITMIIKYSAKIGLLDIPNDRSSHVAPTPRGAGVAMFFACAIVLVLFHSHFIVEYIGFFSALLVIFLLGIYDDNREASPKWKIVFIVISILLIFFIDELRIDTLGTWFGVDFDLHWTLALLVTIVAVVGFTNALNLLDGLDGLAGSVSLVIFSSFLYIGYIHGDTFMITVSLSMIATLVGFLFFNWSPASIFMGDSGSLVLGFTVAVVAIKSIDYINVMAVLFITALPIIDTIVVMTRRIQRGLSAFNPDKTHIHHKVLTWRGSVDHSVLILILLQVHFSVAGVFFKNSANETVLLLILIVLFLFFNLLDERRLVREKLYLTRIKKKVSVLIKNTPQKSLIVLVIAIVLLLILKAII